MVKLAKLSRLTGICFDANYKELYKEFNKLRGRALCHGYCDFTYECTQIVESCSTEKYPKEFLDRLMEIINE